MPGKSCWLLATSLWQMRAAGEGACGPRALKGRWIGSQARVPPPQQAKSGLVGGPGACATSAKGRWIESRKCAGEGACNPRALKGRWIVNSTEVRVNKRDSPRDIRDIHIDRKQPLGVSLKGSSLVSFGTEEAASGVRLKAGPGSDLASQLFG